MSSRSSTTRTARPGSRKRSPRSSEARRRYEETYEQSPPPLGGGVRRRRGVVVGAQDHPACCAGTPPQKRRGNRIWKVRLGNTMAQAQTSGTIVQCIGAVVDIEFPRDAM